MKKVGLVGWRGMVGSVLMQRMRDEKDFATIDPVFFTTSQVGLASPEIGKPTQPLKDAFSIEELSAMDIIVTCQGGDYTKKVYTDLYKDGWSGYWIDSASTLRMEDESAALFNRFRCLKFVHHFFPKGHRLHEPDRPQNEKLELELAEELPGILNWALRGLRRVNEEGFTTPEASIELQDTLETEGAPIQTFASERLVKDSKGSTLISDVYDDYLDWCEERDIEDPVNTSRGLRDCGSNGIGHIEMIRS